MKSGTASRVVASSYHVKKGSYVVKLTDPAGTEVYRNEVKEIALPWGTEQERVETVPFTPTRNGTHTLSYAYTDETRENTPRFTVVQQFTLRTDIQVNADKAAYFYRDNARVEIRVNGAGRYSLTFACPEAGILREQEIEVQPGQFSQPWEFTVPIGVKPVYPVEVTATGPTGIVEKKSIALVFRIK